MRTIIKNPNPPVCLTKQPAALAWRDFMQTQCHARTAESLLVEQHALCCYCESEVDLTNSHVEHLIPQSSDPARRYDYHNLAQSCNGGSGQDRHCGHYKGSRYSTADFVPPHDAATETLFRYQTDGHIEPASDQQSAKASYMLELLALNCPSLRGRRSRHARQLINTLGLIQASKFLLGHAPIFWSWTTMVVSGHSTLFQKPYYHDCTSPKTNRSCVTTTGDQRRMPLAIVTLKVLKTAMR